MIFRKGTGKIALVVGSLSNELVLVAIFVR